MLPQLEAALRANGHEPSRVVVDADIEPVIAALRAARPDLVFNLAESFAGKSALESSVAALLSLLGLRYTGSSPSGLVCAGDKSLTKPILAFHRIRTPEFATVYRGALEHAGELRFPVIVKPPQEDASVGISSASVVHDLRALLERLHELQARFGGPALMEEYVEGREFYVGVLGNASPRALPVIELDFTGFPADRPRIASFEAKWGDEGRGTGAEFEGSRSVFPTDLDPQLAERMQQVAVECFQALRLRDYARIDLRVTAAGEIHVIEVNPNCYLERGAEFARAAERAGMPYQALVQQIVELAMARYAR